MEHIIVGASTVTWQGTTYQAAVGKGGIVLDKKEGDGGTPAGCFPIRKVFYRPDRVTVRTSLPLAPLTENDGWCDEPFDPLYNQQVTLPYPASHESLWREDHIYDVVVVLGYNDDPPVPGRGSAIFMHVARESYSPTRGCVALSLPDLLQVLKTADPATRVCVEAPAP